MVFVVTSGSLSGREFNGVFRTREEANRFIEDRELLSAAVFPEPRIPLGEEKKTVYISQRPSADGNAFIYDGAYEDFESASRAAGPRGHVLSLDI